MKCFPNSVEYTYIFLFPADATASDCCDLINELETISAIDCHENIVNLIGACTSEDG